MAPKPKDPGMWINPKSNLGGGTYSSAFGEGQNTHNSRFLELADVALTVEKPARKKAMAAAGATSSGSTSNKTVQEHRVPERFKTLPHPG